MDGEGVIGAGGEGWGVAGWEAARWGALVHGVAPLLGCRLLGGQAVSAPASFSGYLREQSVLNAARVGRLMGELGGILDAAAAGGLSPLPLKGGALFLRGWACADSRPMSDLDLLVREEEREALEGILVARDFVLTEESPRHREFSCARFPLEAVSMVGEHPDNPIRVEVHTWAGQYLLSLRRYEVTEALWGAVEPFGAGLVPTRAGLMLHLLLHAGANAAKRRVRWVQLRDVALHAERLSVGDWDWVLGEARGAGAGALVFGALGLAAREAGAVIPGGVLEEARGLAPGGLVGLVGEAPLWSFSALGGEVTPGWEMQWLSAGARRRVRLMRAVPLHRVFLSPVQLRERYHLPLDAHPVRAYAIHLARMLAWPFILALRKFKR